MDDFSFILIDLSLDAVARDPSLHERFYNGDDNILFQKPDFEDPGTSAVFRELRRIRPLADKLDDFASICKRPIEQVPTLEAFLASHAKPRASAVPATTRSVAARPKPDGMSNLDYIRSTLGTLTQAPTSSPSRSAVSEAAAGQTRIALSDRIAKRASALTHAVDGNWPWWLGMFLCAMFLLMFITSV